MTEESTLECLDKKQALAFVGNRLKPSELEAIEDHLLSCEACFELVQKTYEYADAFSLFVADSEATPEAIVEPTVVARAQGEGGGTLSGWSAAWRWFTEPSISVSGFQLPRIAFVAVGLFGLFLIPFFMPPNIVDPIADRGGTIGLAASGRVVNEWGGRLAAEPAGWVSQLLKGESIQLASAAQSLTASLSGEATMLGTRGPTSPVPILESPTDSLVKALPFAFRWKGVEGVTDYEVKIVQSDGDPVIHRVSGATRVSSADLSFTFVPGSTYRWYVEGIVGPDVIELPISDQTSFGILDANSAAEVASIEDAHGDSLLILTSAYLRFGLYDDASRTLDELETLNPGHARVARMREILNQAE